MNKERLIVFIYRGHLAYATEREYDNKLDYMYSVLANYMSFNEAKDYLTTVCNYDESDIIDKTDEGDM